VLNFSPEKLFLVGVIALVVLGPGRLPQAARSLGRLVAELRRMSSSFQDEVRDAMGDSLEPIKSTANTVTQLRRPDIRKTLRDTLSPPGPAASGQPGAPATSWPTEAGSAQPENRGARVPDDPNLN
jgi:sec-independent protein translocase protein TatB